MKINYLYCIVVTLLLSCSRVRYKVTDDYFFASGGVPYGFSIALLNVSAVDLNGAPRIYTDSIRIDLYRIGNSEIREKIFFFKNNKGYVWRRFLSDEETSVLPISFQPNNWYVIWGNDLKDGFFKSDYHSFFLYFNSEKKVIVYEKKFQSNL